MWAMIVKEFRELRRDRRTMAMLVMLPLMFLVVFGYATNFSVDSIPTVVVGPSAGRAAEQLPEQFSVDSLARARPWDQIHEAADRGVGVLVTTHYV